MNTFLPEDRRVIYLLVNVHDDIKRPEILDLLGEVSFALLGDEVDFLRRLVQIAGYKKEFEVLIVIKLVVSVLNVYVLLIPVYAVEASLRIVFY